MKQHDQGSTPRSAENLDVVDDNSECVRKEHQLWPILIKNATGSDISSFPTPIQDPLDTLACLAALLGLDYPTRLAYKSSLSKLSSDQLQVQLHLLKVKKIEKELQNAVVLARHRLALAASWDTFVEDAVSNTASLERQKKTMSAKAKDYQRELSTVMSEGASEQYETRSITSLLSLQESLRLKEREVKALMARLKAFEGLPPNLELAKVELASARENQIRLMNTREKLLGRMTQGLN